MLGHARRTRLVALLAGGVAWLAAAGPGRADESMIPTTLPPPKREALKKFLAGTEKPATFVPAQARLIGSNLPAAKVDLQPDPKAEVKQYLAAVIPHRAADRQAGPERADVYWYRPHPKKGSAGVTVRQTVDLTSGTAVGNPDVLIHYKAPLTREERAQAIDLARQKDEAVRAVYAAGGEVEVSALFEMVTTPGPAGDAPGDRVVYLQFRKKGAKEIVAAKVNLTKEAVTKP